MQVYFANIALIYLWAILLLAVKPNNPKKIAYCAIVCLQWSLISGLRHYTIGADTEGYMISFNRVKGYSWSSILTRIWDYIKGAPGIKDPGYNLFQKIFQIFSDDYQIYLIFIALFFTISMAIWIYKNSDMPCMSFIIYSSLFFSFFAVTGHRQTIVTAFVCFIGYRFIKDRKPVPFFLFCLVSFFIHKSIIIYATFYFFANKKFTFRYLSVFAAISAAILLLGRRLYGRFILMLSYDDYDVYVNTPRSYIIFIIIVSVGAFAFYNEIKERRPDDYLFLYNSLLFTLLFTLLTIREQTFMRVQQYYALSLMITVPEIVKCLEKKVRFIPYVVVSGVFLYRLYSSHQPYLFFWQ